MKAKLGAASLVSKKKPKNKNYSLPIIIRCISNYKVIVGNVTLISCPILQIYAQLVVTCEQINVQSLPAIKIDTWISNSWSKLTLGSVFCQGLLCMRCLVIHKCLHNYGRRSAINDNLRTILLSTERET